MRKLIIFLYFVFLFKLAFAESFPSIPGLNSLNEIEPAAGMQLAQNQVPELEEEDGLALPPEFDTPVVQLPGIEAPSLQAPQAAVVPPAIEVPDEFSAPQMPESPETGGVVTLQDAEVSDLPSLEVDAAPAAPQDNIERALSDESGRDQFPETPDLGFENRRQEKGIESSEAAHELSPEDREKEVDSLLNQVFDKEKTPEQLAQDREQEAADLLEGRKARATKTDNAPLLETLVDVNEKSVRPIDDLRTDDDELFPLAEMPASLQDDSSPFNNTGQGGRNVYTSSTYSEQQLAGMLVSAAMRGDRDAVINLIHSGRSPNVQNIHGESPLMGAVYANNNDVVELLLAEGADVNITDNKGNTPLIVGAARNNLQAVQQLIRNGADIDLANNSSDTALMVAVLNGNVQVVDMLVRQGADINKPNADGLTALHIAAYNGNAGMVQYLLGVGANTEVVARGGQKPYDLAMMRSPQVAQLLSNHSASRQKTVEASNLAREIKLRNELPAAPVVAAENDKQYAMFPSAYSEKPAPVAPQLPRNDWWWAAQDVPDEAAKQKQTAAAPASLQKADYSSMEQGTKPAPASLAHSTPVEDKKWTKLTSDSKPVATTTVNNDADLQKRLEQQFISSNFEQATPAVQSHAVKAVYDNNGNLINQQPVAAPKAVAQQPVVTPIVVPAQTAQAAMPLSMRSGLAARPTASVIPQQAAPVQVQAQTPAPVVVQNHIPNRAAPTQPVQQLQVQHSAVKSAPAVAQAPVRAAPVPVYVPAPVAAPVVAQRAPVPVQPVQVAAPISNSVNLNIPRYAELEPAKQAVWDMKLEEWVRNSARTERSVWMQQQSVFQAVYQEQFNSKVSNIKRRMSPDVFSPSSASGQAGKATVESRPVRFGSMAAAPLVNMNAAPAAN